MKGDYKQRKLRYGQCVLLGIEIECRRPSPHDALWAAGLLYSWKFVLPPSLRPKQGYVPGYYNRRWKCVDAALRTVGVPIDDPL